MSPCCPSIFDHAAVSPSAPSEIISASFQLEFGGVSVQFFLQIFWGALQKASLSSVEHWEDLAIQVQTNGKLNLLLL